MMSKCGSKTKKRTGYMSGGAVKAGSIQELERKMCKGNKDSSSGAKEY